MKKQMLMQACLILPLLFLSSCAPFDWLKGKKATPSVSSSAQEIAVGKDDIVLARIDNKPVVTVRSLDEQFKQLLEDNPQYKQLAEDPQYKEVLGELKENFFRTLVDAKVISSYVKELGLDKSAEYLKKRERIMFAVETMLNSEFFEKEFPVTVSESDIRGFYDEHKNDLVISRGGVATVAVQFEKDADAKAFLAKVTNGKMADFKKIAEGAGLKDKIHDLKLVNAQSVGIDPVLRDKILAIKKVPSVELIKVNDKNIWVVNVTSKEEPKYRTFEEVKEQIKRTLEQKKKMEKVQQELEAIKKKMNVEINNDYFKSQKAKPEEAAQQAANQSAAGAPKVA